MPTLGKNSLFCKDNTRFLYYNDLHLDVLIQVCSLSSGEANKTKRRSPLSGKHLLSLFRLQTRWGSIDCNFYSKKVWKGERRLLEHFPKFLETLALSLSSLCNVTRESDGRFLAGGCVRTGRSSATFQTCNLIFSRMSSIIPYEVNYAGKKKKKLHPAAHAKTFRARYLRKPRYWPDLAVSVSSAILRNKLKKVQKVKKKF